ncbi:paratose synthase [Bacteroidia bacterium]|nr:paratose synthase [Bacteroidia bacterium]
MMKTILITGINGFLGSHLAKRLSTHFRVIGTEYKTDNLYRLDGYDFKVVDSSTHAVENLFAEEDIDCIIHTATFYGRNNEEIQQIAETNVFMPFHLLDMAIKKQVKTFINTDTVLDRFVSAYALTKNQFKDWLYFRRNEIQTINMQLEHFYGPGCSNSNFVTAMIERLKNNDPVIDLTAGAQLRDFVYYEDIIDAYATVLSNRDTIKTNSTFQVGSGEHISIKELLLFLKEKIGSTSILNFGAIPYRENDLMISETDIEPLISIDWKPKHTIKEGLIKTISQ